MIKINTTQHNTTQHNTTQHNLFFALTFSTLFTPKDNLGVKKFFLFIIILLYINEITEGLKHNKKIFIFSVVLPVVMYMFSVVMTSSMTSSFYLLYPFVYIFLIFPSISFDIDWESITIAVGNMMAGFIVFFAALDFFGILDIYDSSLLTWLNKNNEAMIGKPIFAMFKYMIFLKASPVMFFNLMYYIKKSDKLMTILIFTALLFTGTRANIYLSTTLLIFAAIFGNKDFSMKRTIAFSLIIIFLFFGSELVNRFDIIMKAKNSGDISRSESFSSIIKAMNSDPIFWVVGMGIGSSYYSVSKRGYTIFSELSYMEFIRQTGIFLGIPVLIFIFYPVFKIYKTDRFFSASYAAYLAAGMIDPFIFSSTGFFVISLAYFYILKSNVK